jgi:type I restriction enzyme S subunit
MEVKPGFKQTEVGVIPEDWYPDYIENFAVITTGSKNTQDRVEDGQYPFFVRSQTVERINSYSFDGEAVLTAGDGVGTGRVFHYINGRFDVHQRVYRISNFAQRVNGYFFYLNFSTHFYNRIMQMTAKSSVDSVRRDMISLMQVALPPTEVEQRAIAAALSDVDALLGGLDRLIAKKRDLKQAAMQQLLTGQTRLPGFSGAWEDLEFGEIASIRNAKVVASSVPSGTQCVELESIGGEGSGRLLMSTDATGMSSKYSFKKGDVLFGRLRAYLRKHWLATFDGICSTEIWPLIARDTRLCGAFLHLLVQTDDFVNSAGVSYGTHMPRSDWTVLKKLPVRLPTVPEQTAIAAVLADMDAELAAREARRDKIRDLKQAMMQELLTGKTRLV